MHADGHRRYAIVEEHSFQSHNRGDIEFQAEMYDGTTPSNGIYMHGQNWLQVTSYRWENPVDSWVCAKGARTADFTGDHQDGVMCGQIVLNDAQIEMNDVLTDPLIVAMVDYGPDEAYAPGHADRCHDSGTGTDYSPRAGDSGAPVFSVYDTGIAQGIHHGGCPGREWYTKVGYALQDLNLELVP